jgi:hypothetical protein
MGNRVIHFDTGNKCTTLLHVYFLSICGRMFQAGYTKGMKKITNDIKKVTCKSCLKRLGGKR